MPIITQYEDVAGLYADAAAKGWTLPCFCSENLTTTEAVFSAAEEFAVARGFASVPVTIAMTIRYSHRPQATYYTRTRRWDIGLKLFRADIEALAEAFPHVDIMIHLDHVQWDDDAELLGQPLDGFSSIMYDASALPFEENIAHTAAFVDKMKGKILIEGACDEIQDATGSVHCGVTKPEDAERYMKETGADMIVANLGTEHRASGKDLIYHGDDARLIRDRIGTKIVLHGASSVKNDRIAHLFNDGVCKVNIWTALERDSAPDMFAAMVRNASKTAGPDMVDQLIAEGLLTENCRTGERASLSAFTQAAMGEPLFEKMKKIVGAYLELWYK